jgi:hypothetical protein
MNGNSTLVNPQGKKGENNVPEVPSAAPSSGGYQGSPAANRLALGARTTDEAGHPTGGSYAEDTSRTKPAHTLDPAPSSRTSPPGRRTSRYVRAQPDLTRANQQVRAEGARKSPRTGPPARKFYDNSFANAVTRLYALVDHLRPSLGRLANLGRLRAAAWLEHFVGRQARPLVTGRDQVGVDA